MSKLLLSFPQEFEPNKSQIDLLRGIEKAFSSGKKFVIARAPTGSGKSFISRTLGNASNEPSPEFSDLINTHQAFKTDQFGEFLHEMECMAEPPCGAFALTISKQLQDQYKLQFPETQILKGKGNYKCVVDENFDVESAPCIFSSKLKNDCWQTNRCLYYSQRNRSILSKFSTLSYSMFLAMPGHVKHRNYIICDEASELEDELVNRFGITVDYAKMQIAGLKVKKLVSDKYDNAREWVFTLHHNVVESVEKLMDKAGNDMSNLSIPERIKLKFLRNQQHQLETITDLWMNCEFIIDKSAEKVSVTPLNVNGVSNNIFKYGDKVLLMSATITRPELFARTLGIKDYEFVEVGSTFEAKKSPIYISTKNSLNYENMKKNLPIIAAQVQQICDAHPEEKGIIHTHSSDICSYLQEQLKGDRFIFRDEKTNNEQVLKEHYTSKEPTVIVSPSLGFGTDLHGDKGRFQIIVKTPFPPLSNKRIKKKFDDDKSWYTDKTINALIQMSGRCTRSKEDHSTTYILDGTSYRLVRDNVSTLPKYFVERIV